MRNFCVCLVLWVLACTGCHGDRLKVNGTHFVKDGVRVFLSGTNIAWVYYGYDFGNDQYKSVRGRYEQFIRETQASGGNSIRVWLHVEGANSPHFDDNGYVDGTDAQNTLISDMRTLLQYALQNNVLVFFCLWNGALKQNHERLDGLIKDTDKLQSYIDKALVPMVNGLKTEPALGGWEIMNEPEGEMDPTLHDSEPCYDTSKLSGSGMGWAGKLYTAQQIQRFINWQADAIRNADPGAMVTLGTWNPKSNTDSFGLQNFYKDSCLIKAGGKPNGTLTFYQTHTYSWQGKWDGYSPFQHEYKDYELDKPLVVGEYRASSDQGESITDLYNYVYNHGYAGGWGWQAIDNNWNNIKIGITALKGKNDQTKGGLVNFKL